MSDKVRNVLFVGTGNAARRILAEGPMNHLAGLAPQGEVGRIGSTPA